MLRFNLLLLFVAVLCALGVVTAQHHARVRFQALEAERERGRHLDVTFGELQIELSTWATHPRIEKVARERLRMVTADAAGRAEAPRLQAVRGGR